MINDLDLDRVLTGWLAEGGERAPAADVEAALARVATTAQRRPWRSRLGVDDGQLRWVILAAALLVLAAVATIGIGAALVRPSPPGPDPSPPPAAVATVSPPAVELQPISVEDWSANVSIPTGWEIVEEEGHGLDFRHFAGTSPEGHLSVNHESPYAATVCAPACTRADLPFMIPYSATIQLEALRDGVSAIAGATDWKPLDDGVLPEVEGGQRLETRSTATDGRPWRHVFIIGLRDRNAVAFAWSQPADAFDAALFDAIIRETDLPSAPVYSDGDLLEWPTTDGIGRYTMPIPGHWITAEQPTLDGVPISGVDRYGDGALVVSIGGPDGTLGWCDPDCIEVDGQGSLDAIEATVRAGRTLGPSVETTLGGEPARAFGTDTPVARRYVVALHDGRPVALRVDVGEWDVADGIPEQMIEGFAFADPVIAPADRVWTTGGGRVELGLSDAWTRSPVNDALFMRAHDRLSVRVGDDDGAIVTCEVPAGPWERCREITVKTLEELVGAIQPAPIDDHGVRPPSGRRETGMLDGEPAVFTRIPAYEYPARGGQEVAYLAAFHDGRPYLVRIRTTQDSIDGLESIIAGFRFVD